MSFNFMGTVTVRRTKNKTEGSGTPMAAELSP